MNPTSSIPALESIAPAVERAIHSRRSALAFADRELDEGLLARLFEAARWSASSSNEQPWQFLVVTRRDREAFERLGSTLAPGNSWALLAPVLVLTTARREFEAKPRANRHAGYDLGQSVATLTLLAEALGLASHQMGGFDAARARELFAIPEAIELYSVIALGHPGAVEDLSEPLKTRARATRNRRPLGSLVWSGAWGTAAAFATLPPPA